MQHYNPSIGEDLHRIFNLKGQSPTNEVSEEIVPVINIESPIDLVKYGTADSTLYTTPTDKDFYLDACMLMLSGISTSAGTNGYIQATLKGVVTTIFRLEHPTLTASEENVFCPLPRPIKIDRGTNITITGGANLAVRGIIYGHHSETLKGV